MQIKYKEKSIDIIDKKITGIVSNSVSNIIKFNENLGNEVYIISYFNVQNMNEGIVEDFLNAKKNEDMLPDVLKTLNINSKILSKNISELSTSEKIKLLIVNALLKNYEVIYFDNILPCLDSSSRTKLYKLIIKLKKFQNKTILISDINIDNIFEFRYQLFFLIAMKWVPSVYVLIIVSDTIINGNKYDVFPCDIINNPITLTLRDKILENKNIDIGKVDSVNELIKAIYREIR